MLSAKMLGNMSAFEPFYARLGKFLFGQATCRSYQMGIELNFAIIWIGGQNLNVTTSMCLWNFITFETIVKQAKCLSNPLLSQKWGRTFMCSPPLKIKLTFDLSHFQYLHFFLQIVATYRRLLCLMLLADLIALSAYKSYLFLLL